MRDEFEVISHEAGNYKMFVVNMLYRTPHVHKDFEVCLLLDGSLSLLSRGRTFTYKKGDLWVVNPFESHELAASQPALILSLQISPSFFAPVFPQMENLEFSLEAPADPRVLLASLLEIASAYFQKEGEDASLRLAGLIFLFFDRLLSAIPHVRLPEKERQMTATKARRIRTISDYIDEHYSEKLLLTDHRGQAGADHELAVPLLQGRLRHVLPGLPDEDPVRKSPPASPADGLHASGYQHRLRLL